MDLGTVGLSGRSAEDRLVLGIDEHLAAIDQAIAGDDAVPGKLLVCHAEVVALVFGQLVQFDEAAVIEYVIDALASRELAALANFFEPGLATALRCLALYSLEPRDGLFPTLLRCHIPGFRITPRPFPKGLAHRFAGTPPTSR